MRGNNVRNCVLLVSVYNMLIGTEMCAVRAVRCGVCDGVTFKIKSQETPHCTHWFVHLGTAVPCQQILSISYFIHINT